MRRFSILLSSSLVSLAACEPASDTSDGEGGAGGSAGGVETAASSGSSGPRACDGYATEVVGVTYGPGSGFGKDEMPGIVLGPPLGAGDLAGSLDVVSLGNGGAITLAFGGRIVDQDGPDFIVFENVFFAGGDPASPYAEVAGVEVSADGVTWSAFPCTASAMPFEGCAGWHPTYAGSDPAIDSHDPEAAGGDAFDLADVGLAEARFVRVVDRADLTGVSGMFDLDAVALVHWACDAP